MAAHGCLNFMLESSDCRAGFGPENPIDRAGVIAIPGECCNGRVSRLSGNVVFFQFQFCVPISKDRPSGLGNSGLAGLIETDESVAVGTSQSDTCSGLE